MENMKGMNRREFLATAAAAGAGTALIGNLNRVLGQTAPTTAPTTQKVPDLNVALIGAGTQGRVLLGDCLQLPGIRFRAICDIWQYQQTYAANIVKKAKQDRPKVYFDYKEMLDAEKGNLQAVIVATPDWMHAEHACAAMEAGLDVYCEKEMSNTLEGARKMVLAARKTGRKLQIGHQRRSNLFYVQALEMLYKENVCGRITNCYGQWNRPRQDKLVAPDSIAAPKDVLEKYGYETMDRLVNWRWYRKFSGGPIVDLGSHQIDVFTWFLGTNPSSVVASGGLDYYTDGREWYDNVVAVFEYRTSRGMVRAIYQLLSTTCFGLYYETFMGDRGTLNISEKTEKCFYMPEPAQPKPVWIEQATMVEKDGANVVALRSGPTIEGKIKKLGLKINTLHSGHLQNFFDAIRNNTPLNCPPEQAYASAVAVLKVNEAVASGNRILFRPEEFKI